jgi:asparagine synthase (glutamine-hydrolysing)
MCGIAGIFETEATMGAAQRRETIQRMCGVIEHRGPDDEGFHIDGGLAIGCADCRSPTWALGINRSPTKTGPSGLWFNGEIYNFQELRDDLVSRGHIFQTEPTRK